MNQPLSYELAKELSKYVSEKTCVDCSCLFVGGHKAKRCKPCQALYRKSSRSKWDSKHYLANRERLVPAHVARQNERRKNDPLYREQEKTRYHKRRSRMANNGGNHTTKEWLELVKRHKNRCVICGEEKKLTRDHILPISKGGSNDIKNIQPLCGSCNSRKKDNI